MKTLLLFLLGFSCSAQYIAVTFNSPTSGAPTNLWKDCVYQSNTNTRPAQILFTIGSFNAYMATNMAGFLAWQTNTANPQWLIQQNYTAWFNVYTQMPIGIQDSSNRIATFNSLLSSWSSGTNTASQTNSIIKQTIQNQSIVMTYLNQIIGYLSRLGPGLQQVYQPANDPVGH